MCSRRAHRDFPVVQPAPPPSTFPYYVARGPEARERRPQDADARRGRRMNPCSRLMTGSRASLADVGRSSPGRHGHSKRRCLDVPLALRQEDVDEEPEYGDAGVGDGVLRGGVSGAATCGSHHGDADRAQARRASPTTAGDPRWTPCWSDSRSNGDEEWWTGDASAACSAVQSTPSSAPRTIRAVKRPRICSAGSVPVEGDQHKHGEQGQHGQDGGYGSEYSDGAAAPAGDQRRQQGWSQLPAELLVDVFQRLRLRDLGRVAQVCRSWRRASQEPCLWRTAEFTLGSSLRPEPTPPALVNFILEEHAQHLRFVVLRTDSSAESTRGACRILARLVKCSLKTLALMSGAARPPLLDVDEQHFVSALTLVLDHSSPSLRALAVDHTLVDDPSLQALGSSSATSLQLLRCKSCPRLSPGGVLALVDHCRCLRELSLSYTLLSDDLLNALSSERHVCLEVLRVDVYSDTDNALRPISPASWRALVAHSPQLNLVMYLFAIQDEHFDSLFTSYIPVTHLYFGDYVPTSVLSEYRQKQFQFSSEKKNISEKEG
ncbi:F-box/LRR-repeat protein 3-like isoform X1 [Frankliniella occidentalis]|uniref:F-box/LRR-repeat protein 3-like isoform X1 n=1 Tax=Frankliniella occidentalis TaxID=133901 RepID=A0A9C6XV97_FRAOC|nr:F-box/LRR-repeat protein 3-like isoform X1 [Frankliniella occidentalis]